VSLCVSLFCKTKPSSALNPTTQQQQKQKTKTEIKTTTTTALSVSPTLPFAQEKTHQKSNYYYYQKNKNLMISFVLKSFFRFQISSVKKFCGKPKFLDCKFLKP
jgi:hypothetical protein